MSTTINVTVDSGGLSQQNRQQIQANRQARLEADNRKKVEATGTTQRNAALAQQGLNPQGQPLNGTPLTAPRTRDEPAAFRGETEEYFLLRPATGPISNEIQLLSRKLPDTAFVTAGTPTFSATGGPSGSAALQAIAPASGGNYVVLTNQLPTIPVSKYANKPLKDYTLQLFVRLGETFIPGQREEDFTLELVGQSVSGGSTGTFRISMYANLATVGSPSTGYTASSFEYIENSSFNGDVSVYYGNNVPLNSTDPKVDPGYWHHLAISKKGSTLRAFLNGSLLGSATSLAPSEIYLRPWLGYFLSISFGQPQEVVYPGQDISIHGLRFDTKCLYTSNFTPPASL